MLKFIVLLALCGAATPAFAAPVQHFTDFGDDYSYSIARDAHGLLTISGNVAQTDDAFKLVLVGHSVTGTFGAQDVTIPVSDSQIARLNDEFAASEKSEAIAAR